MVSSSVQKVGGNESPFIVFSDLLVAQDVVDPFYDGSIYEMRFLPLGLMPSILHGSTLMFCGT